MQIERAERLERLDSRQQRRFATERRVRAGRRAGAEERTEQRGRGTQRRAKGAHRSRAERERTDPAVTGVQTVWLGRAAHHALISSGVSPRAQLISSPIRQALKKVEKMRGLVENPLAV